MKPAASYEVEHGTHEGVLPAKTGFPPFRDIQLRHWQEIPLEERPHQRPEPLPKKCPPFEPKPDGEVDYVAGWNIRLRAGVRYRLTYDFGKNDAWREIEIVLLISGVPRMELWWRING